MAINPCPPPPGFPQTYAVAALESRARVIHGTDDRRPGSRAGVRPSVLTLCGLNVTRFGTPAEFPFVATFPDREAGDLRDCPRCIEIAARYDA